MTDAAMVHLHGVRIGELVRVNELEDYVFRYDDAWREDPDAPVLGQLFIDRRPGPIETSGMPCWFAHLLPGGPWRRHLQRWAGLDADDDDNFALLVAIGHDLPGAVTLEAATVGERQAVVYAQREQVPDGAIRFSLAGAQWKLSVRRGERGLTVPAEREQGFYIAKFEDPAHPGLPRVEFVTTRWAALCGLDVHAAELLPLSQFEALPEGIPAQEDRFLCLERFDRAADARVHMEDFAQIMDRPPVGTRIYQGSYEEIAAIIASLCPQDLDEYIARLVFMVVSGNGDAHLKNWSVLYPDRIHPRLSPSYDLVATVVYPRIEYALALELGGTRCFTDITVASFDSIAALAGRPPSTVQQQVAELSQRMRDVWQQHRGSFELTERERERIDAHLASLRLGV